MENQLKDRQKWVGTHRVHMKSWAPAFSLMAFYEFEGCVAVRDQVHIKYIDDFLASEDDFKRMVGRLNDTNNIMATFELTDDYFMEDGPNHNGLAIVDLQFGIPKKPVFPADRIEQIPSSLYFWLALTIIAIIVFFYFNHMK